MKSVPLILCFLLLIGAFICESNANNDNNDINDNIEEQRTVETKSGKIRGIKSLSSLNDIPYYSFKGMPYHPSIHLIVWSTNRNKINNVKKKKKKLKKKNKTIYVKFNSLFDFYKGKITHNKILKKFSEKIRIKEFQIFPP